MIWNWVRYVLILASVVLLAQFLYQQYEFSARWGSSYQSSDLAIASGIILNLVYLVFGARRCPASGAGRPPRRFSRLVGLWLDAKEAELRKRAGK
jgi:hypothetical protein